MKLRYTTPRIVKGAKPTNIPKGSTLEKEWAKNIWYINYTFNGKQYRIKGGLNRIEDHKKKDYEAKVLLKSIEDDLANGYDPENPDQYYEKLSKETITLADAVNHYLSDIQKHNRKKTVQSYQSKLRYLSEAFPTKQVKDISTKEIENYIKSKIVTTENAKMVLNGKVIVLGKVVQWTPATVKAARRVFSAFFAWCKSEGYVTTNPMAAIDTRKIKSEVEAPDRHIPFNDADIKMLMNHLDEHDPFTAFFCRMIYSTCLRPAEISKLKIKNIDLEKNQITVPVSVMKNTKKNEADILDIEPNFLSHIQKLNLAQYPKDWYLTSNPETFVGETSIGNNIPYKRFVKALEKLSLNGKGYTLYSFKHFSNIQRLNSGWTIAEIMKVNRHGSIAMTEKYLKNITRQTDISKKDVPKI